MRLSPMRKVLLPILGAAFPLLLMPEDAIFAAGPRVG